VFIARQRQPEGIYASVLTLDGYSPANRGHLWVERNRHGTSMPAQDVESLIVIRVSTCPRVASEAIDSRQQIEHHAAADRPAPSWAVCTLRQSMTSAFNTVARPARKTTGTAEGLAVMPLRMSRDGQLASRTAQSERARALGSRVTAAIRD
jgi:hypothetical protein